MLFECVSTRSITKVTCAPSVLSTVIFEGDSYSNVFVYTDWEGRTVRGWDISCLDFATQADAQRFYDATGRRAWWILDHDRDGIAAERDNGEFTRDTAASYGVRYGGQVDVWPAGAIDTGGA